MKADRLGALRSMLRYLTIGQVRDDGGKPQKWSHETHSLNVS
jgi:hypothetical protein